MDLVQKQSPEPPAPRQLTHATIQGMLHTLDPHSNYMDESEFRLLREEQKGSFFGIGAIIQQHDQGIVIISPMKGGPAERLGVRSGDIIKEIDGTSTEGMSSNAALQKLRGEKGTLVELAVQRAGIAEPAALLHPPGRGPHQQRLLQLHAEPHHRASSSSRTSARPPPRNSRRPWPPSRSRA